MTRPTATAAATRAPAPAGRTLPRLLLPAGESGTAGAHLRRHGAVPYRGGPGLLIDTVEDSGLTGRGGAGFPTGRKWRAVATGKGRSVVVGNAAEGEPASAKDRTLLITNPHLVLDGLQLAAEAVGAPSATLFLDGGGGVRESVAVALTARPQDRVPITVVEARVAFLSGEESAVVDALEGGVGLPTSTPPRVFERGVGGRPTLVQNIETLAQVALIARYGPGWFRSVGTSAEPGSMLVTVTGRSRVPAVYDVAHGTALSVLVGSAGSDGGDGSLGSVGVFARQAVRHEVSAVLLGGYHGTWVSAADVPRLALTRESLGAIGASPGAGVVVALPASICGLVESARVLRFLAEASAGQCGPCLNGLPRIALTFGALSAGTATSSALDDLARWSGLVVGRGACHHPDGSMRFLRSALTVFADEVDVHLTGRCSTPGGVTVLPTPAPRAGRAWPARRAARS